MTVDDLQVYQCQMAKECLRTVIHREQVNDKMQDQVHIVIFCFFILQTTKYIDFSWLRFHFYTEILFQQKICVTFVLFMNKSGTGELREITLVF